MRAMRDLCMRVWYIVIGPFRSQAALQDPARRPGHRSNVGRAGPGRASPHVCSSVSSDKDTAHHDGFADFKPYRSRTALISVRKSPTCRPTAITGAAVVGTASRGDTAAARATGLAAIVPVPVT